MAGEDEEIETFLRGIDPGLCKFKAEFIKYEVRSLNTLRYLRPREVDSMELPEVFKRMLTDKIVNLQTPETKTKMKGEVRADDEVVHNPKRLKFGKNCESVESGVDPPASTDSEGTSAISARSRNLHVNANDSFLTSELSRLTDEKETLIILLSHKNDDLKDLKRKPPEQEPLGIPGNPITKFICDNCHHRGHRATMNRGNKKCPYMPCEGFHVCGIEAKHTEHKQALAEAVKEIVTFEKRMKAIDEEIASIKTFVHHNTTNFITAMRPVLKGHFPHRYSGQQGAQLLQKEMRLLKIACGGKMPSDLGKENITKLIESGRSKVASACGTWEDHDPVTKTCSSSGTLSTAWTSTSPSSSGVQSVISHNTSVASVCQVNTHCFSNTYQSAPQDPVYTASSAVYASPSTSQYWSQHWNQSPQMQPWGYYWNSYLPVVTSPIANAGVPLAHSDPTYTGINSPPLPTGNPPENPPLPNDGDQ